MKRSRKVLLLLFAIYVLCGLLVPLTTCSVEDVAAANVLLGVPTAVSLFTWCKLDSAERHITPPPSAALLVGGLAPVGVPFYFLRTMPLRPALFAILKSVSFFMAINGAQILASMGSALWSNARWRMP